MFPPGIYDVPPTVDPGTGIPNGGMIPSHPETFTGMAVNTALWCTQLYASVAAAAAFLSGQIYDICLLCIAAMLKMIAASSTFRFNSTKIDE